MARPRTQSRRYTSEPDVQSHERDVRWVMDNLEAIDGADIIAARISGKPAPSGPTERQAPSPAAWRLYRLYNVDEETRKSFAEKIYAKVVTKEKPQESSKTMSDDQRKFFRLFELLEIEKPELLNDSFPRTTDVAVDPSRVVVSPEPEPVAAVVASAVVEPDPAIRPIAHGEFEDFFALAELVNASDVPPGQA